MAGTGLLLLTGGEGRRLGAPKHDRPHPGGGTWGGALVHCFETVRPGGAIQVLGAPLPDRPELPVLEDPRQGPAAALRLWAAGGTPAEARWLVLACDMVRWRPKSLGAWLEVAEALDPGGEAWVLAEVEGFRQYFGSVLGARLLPQVASFKGRSLWALAEALPCRPVPSGGPQWQDVDTALDLPGGGLGAWG